MDKLTHYRNLIKKLLTEHANLMRSQPLPGEEVVCLFGEDNYILLRFGWVRGDRLHSITLHLRIVDDKIHIEQDWTEGIIFELIDADVPREDIILGFNPPESRAHYAELVTA